MSNYHILEMTSKEHKVKVAFHIVVPDEDNSATPTAVNLQDAVGQYLTGTVTVVPWLETDFATEYAQIESGEVYEKVEIVEFDANLTNLEKRGIIDTRYTALAGSIPDIIRARFKFWGSNRDVT